MFARRPRARVALPPPASAQALPDLGGKTVVVVTENAYFPLQFVDPKTGQPSAGSTTPWRRLAKRLNFKVEYQNTSWDAMIQAVSDKQYDIGMTGITIKDDRKEKVDFSDPYMTSEIFMLVRGDETRFTDAEGLRRRRQAAGRRAGGHVALLRRRLQGAGRQRGRTRASSCSRPSAATVEALQSGDVDLVLTDSAAGKGLCRRRRAAS